MIDLTPREVELIKNALALSQADCLDRALRAPNLTACQQELDAAAELEALRNRLEDVKP